MGTFAFRFRFTLPDGVRLPFPGEVEELDGPSVVMKSLDQEAPLSKAGSVSIRGTGFGTEEDAWAAGRTWQRRLRRGFAVLSIGADFGDWAPGGGFTAAFLDPAAQQLGRPVLNDTHGLMTFPDEPAPVLVGVPPIRAFVTQSAERLRLALALASEADELDERNELAYDVFSASFFVSDRPDARLVLLVMAVELLVEQNLRSPEAVEVVDDLIAAAQGDPRLSAEDRQSLVDGLRWLRQQSIGRACRIKARSLGDRSYDGLPPERFMSRCYEVRSQLVHGHVPRPSRAEVGSLAATLQHFVGHMIAGVDLVNVVMPDRALG